MNDNTTITFSGISFTTLLFLIFLVLKLTGYITWSWWWVTAPLWGGIALLVAIALICLTAFAIAGLFLITRVAFDFLIDYLTHKKYT